MTIRAYKEIRPTIADNAYVDDCTLVIGDVHIGNDSSIWPMTVIRGDVNKIRIGARTNIQDNCTLHVTHPGAYTSAGFELNIGNNVTVAHGAILHGCTLHDYCLVGMGATVMDGAVLHSKVLLAAGSLVPQNKILEGGYVWSGSPVKKSRRLRDDEFAFLEYVAQHYVDLKNTYR